MQDNSAGESGLTLNNAQDVAINALHFFCSILCMPVEIVLRPTYGTRYFPPANVFLSTVLMLFLPLLSTAATAVSHLVPFVGGPPPSGLFDITSFSKLYFLLSFVHGFRLYRRMFKPLTEEFSWYEGPPLPFIQLIPGSQSFWRTRILIEPGLLFATATLLGSFYIFQPGLTRYLQLAALALAMKQFAHWFRSWQMLRDILDSRNSGPLISKFIDDTATEEDLSVIHLAAFPKDTPPELRKAAAVHVARAYGQPIPEGESHETHR